MNEVRRVAGETLRRDVTIEGTRRSEDDRLVDLSFSSEEPVRRWFGNEVLGHQRGEVDLDWFKSGNAPLLVDHESHDQVGVIVKARLGNDRRGHATVRLGRSARAEEIWDDLQGKIRRNVSVGYRIEEIDLVKREGEGADQVATYRATKWAPLEISIVSVPADQSVGVGRSQSPSPRIRTMEHEDYTAAAPANSDGAANDRSERIRVREINALGKRFGQRDLADKMIEDGASVEQARERFLDTIPHQEQVRTASASDFDMFERAARNGHRYSLSRALQAAMTGRDPDGLEGEAGRELARLHGKNPRGFYVPMQEVRKIHHRTTLTSGGSGTGAELVGTTHMDNEYVELLRNMSLVRAAGATVLSGLVGNAAIPKGSAATAAEWVAEDSAPSESAFGTAQLPLSPKTVTAYQNLSRRFILQGSPAADELIRSDLIKTLDLAVDAAALNGSGTNNQPTGILNTAGIGSVADAETDGGAIDWDKVSSLVKEVSIDNALMGSTAFMSNSKVAHAMRTTPKVASTDSVMILEQPDRLLGYRFLETNQVPSNLTKGTGSNLSAMIFGNWSDLIIAEWGVLDILVNPYADSTKGTVRISAFFDVDIAIRRPQSFAAIQDIVAS